MRIKKNITIVDQIAAINYIMDYYFTDGEYTPYYANVANAEAIAKFFIEGVTFDKDEYIYDCVENDTELKNLVHKFCFDIAGDKDAEKHNKENEPYINAMRFVVRNVEDKLEFEKQKRIHCTGEKERLVKDINDTLEAFVDLAKNIKYAAKPVIENPEFGKYAISVLKKLDGQEVLDRDTMIDIVMNLVKEQEGNNIEK